MIDTLGVRLWTHHGGRSRYGRFLWPEHNPPKKRCGGLFFCVFNTRNKGWWNKNFFRPLYELQTPNHTVSHTRQFHTLLMRNPPSRIFSQKNAGGGEVSPVSEFFSAASHRDLWVLQQISLVLHRDKHFLLMANCKHLFSCVLVMKVVYGRIFTKKWCVPSHFCPPYLWQIPYFFLTGVFFGPYFSSSLAPPKGGGGGWFFDRLGQILKPLTSSKIGGRVLRGGGVRPMPVMFCFLLPQVSRHVDSTKGQYPLYTIPNKWSLGHLIRQFSRI